MKTFNKITTTLGLLTLLAACGKDSSMTASKPAPSGPPDFVESESILDGSNIDGEYLATFTTLNPQVVGTIPGSATFRREGDRVWAYVRLFAGAPEAWHPQNIWTGTRCPTLSDDTNNDGYIDILEAATVLGKIIVPLDANINAQNSLRNWYPKGDLAGSYFYEKTASFRSLFADLRRSETKPDELFTKLAEDEGLYIENRAVLIQGVGPEAMLPETVQSMGRFRPFQTLPIACGIFKRVTEIPGAELSDEIPGPVAPVEENQDRPAPEGAGENPGTGTTIRGNDNSADAADSETTNANRRPRDYGEED